MINIKCAQSFCREDISKIAGYTEAITDTTETWICHHINGEPFTGFSKHDLKKMNMYYNRPASELKFVTRSEHALIHKVGAYFKKKAFQGHTHTEESKAKMRAAFEGKHWKLVNGKRVWY